MIAILKPQTPQEQVDHLVQWLRGMNLEVHISQGPEVTVLGVLGDTGVIDQEMLASMEMVQSVSRVTEPFKQASRKFHPEDSVIEVGDSGPRCSSSTHRRSPWGRRGWQRWYRAGLCARYSAGRWA